MTRRTIDITVDAYDAPMLAALAKLRRDDRALGADVTRDVSPDDMWIVYDATRLERDRLLDELARTRREERLSAQADAVESAARQAIATWGTDAQMSMVAEECAELIAAANQWRRGRIPAEKVAEEVADVRIMLAQVEEMIGMSAAPFVATKLERLSKRLRKAMVMRTHYIDAREGST